MFIGHLGAGLVLKSVEPRINVGYFLLASLFLDVLLGIFVLLGIEQIIVPENYSSLHYLHFIFPYSHSLIAAVLWSVAFCGLIYLIPNKDLSSKIKASMILGLAVFLHWVCDLIEHPPQLPIAGNDSSMLGFGLWNSLEIALAVEVLLVIIGTALYLKCSKNIGSKARVGMVVLMALISGIAVAGQLTVTQAPDSAAVAISIIAQAIIVCGFASWIDRPREKTNEVRSHIL